MGSKAALVNYNLCRPLQCHSCAAAQACGRKLMVQESASTAPMTDPYICKGCGDCVRACPLRAVTMTTQ